MGSSSTTYALDGAVVVRLLSAAILGGLVGAEREAADQPAGLRTHIAVALGAGLFGVISTLGFDEFDQRRADSTLQADVTRVASNVVVGIGFLGAGVIFRQGASIRNLTTAASLWTVAAIGLACGVGDVTTAVVATVVLVASLVVLRRVRSFIRRRWSDTTSQLRIRLASSAAAGSVLEALDGLSDVELAEVDIETGSDGAVMTTQLRGEPPAVRQAVAHVADTAGVEAVTQE
jgi:putative Mg2+ transporter-C (MgtC) family protein